MEFGAKVDRYFVLLIVSTIIILAAAIYVPLWFAEGFDPALIGWMTAVFLAMVALILWCSFSVKYVFFDDHLYVKGGPFRSRIPYKSIRQAAPTKNIFTGYRILSSVDAIEIFYDKGMLGSVKISPKDTEQFLAELKKRCPRVRIQK